MGEVVTIQKPLEKLVLEIRAHVHDAGRAETTCAKHQLQAGTRLLALRGRVEAGEAGEISWWEYFDTQFTGHIKSRKYAEKLMKWARSDDPEGAMQADKEQVNAANRERRQREIGVCANSNQESQSEEYDIVEHALRLVAKMNEGELGNFHQLYMGKYQ